jgi:hypothetical protein
MAICQNVQTFCAAQVVYWIGMNGIDYIQNVFIADTSVMENRLIWIALTGLPYVVNTYVSIAFVSRATNTDVLIFRRVQPLAKSSSTFDRNKITAGAGSMEPLQSSLRLSA